MPSHETCTVILKLPPLQKSGDASGGEAIANFYIFTIYNYGNITSSPPPRVPPPLLKQ